MSWADTFQNFADNALDLGVEYGRQVLIPDDQPVISAAVPEESQPAPVVPVGQSSYQQNILGVPVDMRFLYGAGVALGLAVLVKALK